MLSNFWPEEKVAAWKAVVFPDNFFEGGIETAANMVTLCRNAHDFRNKGLFALKPISVSDDNTTLTIQFFWQAKHEQIKSAMNLLTLPPSTRDLDHSGNSYLSNYRLPGDPRIKSGDLFVIKTDNPEARPLPSAALLEIQWFLQRVAGMAGAADVEEDIEEPDDWYSERTPWMPGTTGLKEEPSDLDDARSDNTVSTTPDISPTKLKTEGTKHQSVEEIEGGLVV